jgi:glycolate oxidase iron-sulfur subunit
MDPWFQGVHQATIGLLVSAGYAVEVPNRQTCCGALAAHDGAGRDAKRLARSNVAAFSGFDLVVADAAGCSAHLKEYDNWAEGGAELASRVRDVTEVVAAELAAGRLPVLQPGKGPVAVQDPCHLRHAQRIVEQPRAILIAAGYTPVDVDPGGMCCGAAGIYSVLYPETSDELGRRKAAEVEATGTTVVASANPGCEMQLRRHMDPAVRVAHPIELYWEALQREA